MTLYGPVVFVAALLSLLLLGIALSSGGRQQQHEQQHEQFFVGDAVCEQVPIGLSPRDSPQDKENACRSACRKQGGGHKTMMKGNYLTGVNDSVVACRCCDPASQVTLAAKLPGSASCTPGTSYMMGPTGSRTMEVKRGCKGMFRWGDDTLVQCESNAKDDKKTTCHYLDSTVPTVQVAALSRAKATFLANTVAAEEQAKENERLDRLRNSLRVITKALPRPPGWTERDLNSPVYRQEKLPDGSVWENPKTVDGNSTAGRTQLKFVKTPSGMWTIEVVMWNGKLMPKADMGSPIRAIEWNRYIDDYGASFLFEDGFDVGKIMSGRLNTGNTDQLWTRVA